MKTLLKFEAHNIWLKNALIDDEPVECWFTIDPKDEIFDKQLNQIL